MNWEALGAVGEIVGAVAVVITLIYLAAQMKSHNEALKLTSRQATLMGRAESLRFISGDESVSDLVWQGGQDPDSLSEKEWQRYMMISASSVRAIEMAFIDFEEGRMSAELWSAQEQTLQFWFSQPGMVRFMDQYGQTLYPKFADYIVKNVIEKNRESDT